jgi:putative FmdB family regulatory protein
MPLYEYACEKCGERFEVMQKFADQPLTTHEKCGGPVHRLISAPALQFKGSGWYITDYAKGSGSSSGEKSADNGTAAKTDAPAANSPATSDSPTASSSSSDSKPSKPASSDKKQSS